MSFLSNLDTSLLQLSPVDAFTLRDACAGVHIFGGIGSGKTSGSGRMLAGAFLRAGMGGLVTAVKPEEIELWKRYASEHGRERSLILFDEREGFNFLAYELARQGLDGIGSVTECLMRIIEAAKKVSPTVSQRGGEAFWEDATRQVLRYAIPPLYAASGSLSVSDIIRFINTAPMNRKEPTSPEWQKSSFMYSVMDAASRAPVVPMTRDAFQNAITFWAEEFSAIPDKTRGNIVISVTTALDRFKHGRLQKTFCGRTSLVPELTFHGAVIVLAMPTLVWNEDGIIAQQLFKYLWQRAVLSRNALLEKHHERPVFLWSDEAQETVSTYDAEFLSVCRASKACVCYLTQSLPTYYAKIGGDNPRDAAHALVGKFNTNVFHSNACPDTNEYASRVIGKVVKHCRNSSMGSSRTTNTGTSFGTSESWGSSSSYGSSTSMSDGGGGSSGSTSSIGQNNSSSQSFNWNRGDSVGHSENLGFSEAIENRIEPGDFARTLKTGGRVNGNEVTGVWFQGGRKFQASGSNILLERFKQ